jgi:hypothetical protein
MSKGILLLAFLVGSSAMAETTKVIEIDVYPYLGTLRSNAFDVETQLSEKLTAACGSLENVLKVTEARFETKTMGISEIKPEFKPGEFPVGLARFTFAYPRTTGEVTVICK